MNAAAPTRWLVGVLAAAAVLLFALPLLGLLLRAPWSDLPTLLADPAVHRAMGLSLVSSLAALALAVGFGLPLALWLASGDSRLRTAARLVALLPLVLPPIVAGIALLLAFGRNGVLGGWIAAVTGGALPYTTAATVLAAAYMGMPFFVLSAEAGLRAFDRRQLAVAGTLGAGPWRRFWTVTVPLTLPALRTGALLCWARALGEYCATQMFAGNVDGVTRTMPLACGLAMEGEPATAIALGLVLATASLGVLFLLRRSLLGGAR